MVERLLNEMARDNKSGAAEILRRAAELFGLLAGGPHPRDAHEARRVLIDTCVALVGAQPHMAPLVNLASRVLVASCGAAHPADLFGLAARAADGFSQRAARGVRQAVEQAVSLIQDGSTVLTHSRSSTVLAALIEARKLGRRCEVVATESRPVLEGRTLSQELARHGVKVTLIADAAAAAIMDRVDFVLLGADKVTPQSLVNKVGTRMITLAARDAGKPAYSICDTSKFIAATLVDRDEKSGEELWPGAPAGVELLNRYFEPTPLDHFTAIITEDGPLAPQDARLRALSQPVHQELIDRLGTV
jgi:translation initiation factor 2B subunit (eIF-2B alpha/beta/delta family)